MKPQTCGEGREKKSLKKWNGQCRMLSNNNANNIAHLLEHVWHGADCSICVPLINLQEALYKVGIIIFVIPIWET